MNIERVVTLYEAGRVKRLHCRSTVAEHTIAAHVYGSLVLAVELTALNNVRLNKVLLALLYHDAAELKTGDVPAPVKRENPELSAIFTHLEEKWEKQIGLPLSDDLTAIEKALVKACDTLDLAFNVLHERMMGNASRWVCDVMNNCLHYLEDQSHVIGVEELKRYLFLQFWKE